MDGKRFKKEVSFNRERDASTIKIEDLIWKGTFSCIGYEQLMNPSLSQIMHKLFFIFEYLDIYIFLDVDGIIKI